MRADAGASYKGHRSALSGEADDRRRPPDPSGTTRVSDGMARLVGQLVAFAGLGAVGTGTQFAILALLVEGAAADPVLASGLGFTVGRAINYALNRRFVFRSTRSHAAALPRFFAVALVGLTLNEALMAMLTVGLDVFYLAAQIAVTVVLLFWTFAAHRWWTFRAA